MLFSFVVLSILSFACALPYGNGPKNVVTVPPNCPGDQEWINGACRDIWYRAAATFPQLSVWKKSDVFPSNMISVPPNCPRGQEYINGKCRDIWRGGDLAKSLYLNQQLEQIWNDYVKQIQQTKVNVVENSNVAVNNSPRHIINVPNQCPIGFRADALGICRPIL